MKRILTQTPRFGRYVLHRTNSSLLWLYTSSFVVLIIINLTLSSVLPIDLIVQSKTKNSHLATNTVIILVICAVFIFFSVLIDTFRIFYNKMLLEEIPKPYVPITENDIGGKSSSQIEYEMMRCQKIKKMAKPRGRIEHPGLYHRSEGESENNQFPDNLIYENVIRIIGQEIKYNGTLTVSDNKVLRLDNRYSLGELLCVYKDDETVREFLELYEKLRFGGEAITLHEFRQFLKGWNYVKSKL